MKWFDKAPLGMLVGLTLAIVVGMLYFGVRLKGYRPVNNVEWSAAGEGLYFQRSAMAYTEDFFAAAPGRDANQAGLTIEMLLRVEELGNASFRYILSVHAGSDKRQLLIGQWRQSLMVMNGDDYSNKQGVPKIYVDLEGLKGPIWLAIVADGRGTSVYLDGRLVKFNGNLHLSYPSSDSGRPRLVLGNSVHGKYGWRGAIHGLALYARALEGERLQAHYDQWAARGVFELDRAATPEIFYGFEAPVDGRVLNRAGDAYHLEVPALMRVLKREYLQWPQFGSEPRWYLASDMVLNLVGFAPLGFMLVVLLRRRGGMAARLGWVAALGAACLFSLSMELVQAWIPSRDSSLLDWGLNTLGAGLGAWLGMASARG